uniref:Prolactin 2 n=1 Tax=Salmo trutta TaxID=8032 RepID=A0A674F760_SALTR
NGDVGPIGCLVNVLSFDSLTFCFLTYVFPVNSIPLSLLSSSLLQEQYVLPSRNHIGRINRHCHTATILTPNGKENAQRLAREELTEVILKLLVAWKDPLWQFHQNMHLEMSYMVHELRKGVEKVADRMQNLGMISNSLSGLSSPEALDPSSDTSGESQAMSDHDLLYCFRRDSNKVQNYLKILKCRIVPENGC